MKPVLLSLMLFAVFFQSNLLASVLKVANLKGKVFVGNRKLEMGSEVKKGQFVSVSGIGSFVHLKFDDGSSILLRKGLLEVKKLDKKQREFRLERGKIFVHKKGSGSTLNITTKYASLGVRGTKFFVQQEKDNTYLCVCDGTVLIKNKKYSQFVDQNQDVWIRQVTGYIDKKLASEDMWKVAKSGFKLMNETIPVYVNPFIEKKKAKDKKRALEESNKEESKENE